MYVRVRDSLSVQVTTPSERNILAKRIEVNVAIKMPKKKIFAILSSTSFTVENWKNLVMDTGVIGLLVWNHGFKNSHY